jgi:hypothetical protein
MSTPNEETDRSLPAGVAALAGAGCGLLVFGHTDWGRFALGVSPVGHNRLRLLGGGTWVGADGIGKIPKGLVLLGIGCRDTQTVAVDLFTASPNKAPGEFCPGLAFARDFNPLA